MNWKNLQNTIKRVRLEKGMTQQELADMTGISRPNIARLETSEKNPTVATLEKVCSALGIEIGAVMEKPAAPVDYGAIMDGYIREQQASLVLEESEDRTDLVLFNSKDGKVTLQVAVDRETVWLTQDQIAQLFDRDKSVVSRHIKNIFSEGELDLPAVVANFATTASDGKTYQVDYYSLDVIISVGYRVKSRRGVEFRRWANSVLKDYIIKGYALNDNRLKQLGEVVRLMR